ncbi:ABC transporter permease [Actinomyces israelii]|uniref:ABC transporter permease n=1 Tax=Actinomyces israelii TaxID=1659 RepID=UPI002356B8DC|nr:ABC transporter permease [Actinomyces israelii]
MISLALSTVRGRMAAFAGAFVALVCSAALLSATSYLVESGLRSTTQAQRYARVNAVVVGEQTMRVPGSDVLSGVRLPETVRVPRALTAEVEALPEVDSAVMDDRITMRITGDAAETSPSDRALAARRWSTAAAGGFHIVEGRQPDSGQEMVLTVDEARRRGIGLGRTLTASVDGVPQGYSVVGLVAADVETGEAPTAFLTDAQADSLVRDPDAGDVLLLRGADGVSAAQVRTAVERVLPKGLAVGTGQQVADAEHQDVASGRSLLLLLAGSFGGVAVLVSFFVISSMMNLVLGSRRREFAAFRVLGATPRQLISMVFAEVGILCLASGAVGAPLGTWVASLLRNVFVSLGVMPASLRLVVTPWAGAIGVALVVLCALLASWLVTYSVASMSPVSALRDAAPTVRPVRPWRVMAAGITLALGCMAMTMPLFLHNDMGAAGTGSAALVLVITVALAGPFLLRPVVHLVSAPVRRIGASGFMAAESARADTRRMSGVVIPLVLAVGFTLSMVYSQMTLSSAVATQAEHGVVADVVVAGIGGDPIAPQVTSAVQGAPDVRRVLGVSDSKVFVPVGLFDDVEVTELSASVLSGEDAQEVLDPGVTKGSLLDLRGNAIALDSSTSATLRRGLGDLIDVRLGDGAPARLRVVAIYQRGLGLGEALLPQSAAQGHVAPPTRLLVAGAEGTSQEHLTGSVSAALAPYPAMTTTDRAGFATSSRAEATMAAWVNLLGLLVIMGYVIIAVVNGLVVATNARRRELALLRLVGATRRQVLSTMRWETLMVVVCAVLLGTVAGGLPLIVQAIGFLGSVVPAGPPWIYAAIVGTAMAVGVISVMLPVRVALRQAPVNVIGQKE